MNAINNAMGGGQQGEQKEGEWALRSWFYTLLLIAVPAFI
jgi:hypothetical protein